MPFCIHANMKLFLTLPKCVMSRCTTHTQLVANVAHHTCVRQEDEFNKELRNSQHHVCQLLRAYCINWCDGYHN